MNDREMKPFQICELIESLPVDSVTKLTVVGYLSHADPAVRGVAVAWLMDAYPKDEAAEILREYQGNETIASIQNVVKDFLGELP